MPGPRGGRRVSATVHFPLLGGGDGEDGRHSHFAGRFRPLSIDLDPAALDGGSQAVLKTGGPQPFVDAQAAFRVPSGQTAAMVSRPGDGAEVPRGNRRQEPPPGSGGRQDHAANDRRASGCWSQPWRPIERSQVRARMTVAEVMSTGRIRMQDRSGRHRWPGPVAAADW